MIAETLGQYRIVRMLGRGGMGEVYLAWDARLERYVAVKVLPPELAGDQERVRRLDREARAAAAVPHPGVAHVYEIGEAEGRAFIAMEYVEGEPLDARLRGQALGVAEVVDIALQVADALDAAHTRGVIHRDIKPGNVMVLPRGQIKLMDFGLAQLRRPEGDGPPGMASRSHSTTTGVVMGTVHYLSPEQVLGHAVDGRSDLFALGVTLYEMATRQLPFAGGTGGEILDHILHTEPPLPAVVNPRVPAELERIIMKCLEKDPADRYQSARELCVDLRHLARASDGARPFAANGERGSRAGPGLSARILSAIAPTPLRFWELDQFVSVVVFTPLWLWLAWQVRSWTPGLRGTAPFTVVVLCQSVTTTLRLYLLVASHMLPREMVPREIARLAPWIRRVDLLLMAAVVFLAVLALDEHGVVAGVLLGLAAAGLVKFLVADPPMMREAFSPDDHGRP